QDQNSHWNGQAACHAWPTLPNGRRNCSMNLQAKARECSAVAALYSLGTLSPEESQRFEQRLASGCPLCTTELAEYSNVVDHLALAAPQVEPPPSLRQRLLDRIHTTQDRPPSPPPEGVKEMTIIRGADSPWVQLPVPGVEIRPLLGR